jgi:hypothetical protein
MWRMNRRLRGGLNWGEGRSNFVKYYRSEMVERVRIQVLDPGVNAQMTLLAKQTSWM